MTLEAGLNTILSPLATNKVWAVEAPQNTKGSYIVFEETSERRVYSHGGYSHLSERWFQFYCFGDTYDAAKTLAEQVIDTLEIWNGVQAAFLDGKSDTFEVTTNKFLCLLSFKFWY